MTKETSSDQPSDSFDSIMGRLDPPSVEAQKELFGEVVARQKAEWQEQGILAKLIDSLPGDKLVADGERSITLGRIMRRGPTEEGDMKVAFFQIMHTETEHAPSGPGTTVTPHSVDAAVEHMGVTKPIGRFDQTDADLLMRHITEREALIDEGFLPNLSANLNRVVANVVGGLSLTQPKD